MRILHISDLHVRATGEADQDALVAAALMDIRERDRETQIDLVVFAGDLSFDGTAESLALGRALLLDPITEALPDRRVVLVPGNHDVNRHRISRIVEAGLHETLTSREAIAELFTNPDELGQAVSRLEEWQAFERAWYERDPPRPAGSLGRVFSFAIGDSSVGVACLNSAWRAQGGDEDRGRLLLGEPQVDAALKEIDDHELRIVVVHHPLGWLADFDAVRARAQFEGSGVFILTGHEHSPDPTTEISTRGAALYSRAGCLYASLAYSNSYTLLDLDVNRHIAHATVRRWWASKRQFDQATDLHNSGSVDLPWPHRSAALPAQRAALPDVVSPLVELAAEQSVLSDQTVALEQSTVSDLLVAPRFWPTPHPDAVDSTLKPQERPRAVDPLERLERGRVVILSGPHFSGVTGALLWLLERHFRLRGTHLPAYVRIDSRISLGRLTDALELAVARAGEHGAASTPVLLAIDDAAPRDSRALGRLVRFLQDHPNVLLLIGTHGNEHAPIAETLRTRRIAHDRVFLGPFGRRELRQLVQRIIGADSADVVERVLRTIHSQRLPRNPLNIAALVFVLAREPDLSAVNESGLLQSYVNVLLENPTGVDPEGLTMDYRRREHLLENFADALVRGNQARMQRAEIERFVLDYFAGLGWRAGSAGHLVDSLVRRRVLIEDELGVGFRYPALLHLFAAKWMLENEAFADYLLAEPAAYGQIIQHAAGLRRNDRDLLATIAAFAQRALQKGAEGVAVRQFDLMRDEEGWSQVKDLEDVRALLEAPPRPPTEEELDEIYEEVADSPSEEPELQLLPVSRDALTPLERIEASAGLLASVLRNSELVPDIDFKSGVLKTVIVNWSLSTVVIAVQEDETGVLRELFEEVLEEADPKRRRSLAEHIARVLVVMVMTVRLYVNAGSAHLQGVLERVLDDEEFMSETAHAFFATMLYSLLGLARWPERLSALYRRHGKHPVVRELVRSWALSAYHREPSRRRDEAVLEELLVELLTPERLPAGSVADRAAQKSQILEDLRRSRLQDRVARSVEDGNEDGLLVAEAAAVAEDEEES